MTRCKCCDWSPNSEQSLYNKALVHRRHGRNRSLIYTGDGGPPVCSMCLSEDKTLNEIYREGRENE